MIPDADREQLLEALVLFDEGERDDDRWLTNRAHRYAISHEGRFYPVKQIVSIATGAPVSRFSGGEEANSFVRSRGLEIVEIGENTVSLRGKLGDILSTYASEDRGPFGKDNPIYASFSETANVLDGLEPVEEREQLRVKPSAGQGNWANVPWIALMDKRETTSTQHGVYVVYLFREDMSGVYLTFNQGVTQLFDEHGARRARELLTANAEAVREITGDLPDLGFQLSNENIDLKSSSTLGRRYEESTIAHKFYPADGLPDDEQLESDLEAVLRAYDTYLEQEQETEHVVTVSRDAEDQNDNERLQATFDWIRGKGYYFEPWQLASFVAAAKTKPFVILAGVSGTGKSKLPQLLAAATGAKAATVPVRPDWTDSADLLGYQDLHGRFRAGTLMAFCRSVQAEPNQPAFFVIDEMNLARVEYYFAEVLSRIEDDDRLGGVGGLISGDLHTADAEWAEVTLPPNLLLVGTVNMDETTHGFSKKVLDRAFTLEFSRVELAEWEAPAVAVPSPPHWTYEDWEPRARRLSDLRDVTQSDRALIHSTIETLEEANAILQPAQMQVGYRVRDELALFRLHAAAFRDMFVDAEGAGVDPVDVGLTMKLLPRISGGSNIVRRLIRELLGWSWHGEPDMDDSKVDAAVDDWESAGAGDVLPGATYPRTAGRLCLMWQRLQSEGFTSYWL